MIDITGVFISKKLIDINNTQSWLVDEITKRGQKCDDSYLSKVLKGRIKTDKADLIKSLCLEIIEEFENAK